MSNRILNPEDEPFGQNNAWPRIRRANPTDSELERLKKDEHIRPDVSKNISGPLIGIALENGYYIYPPFPTEYQSSQMQNIDKLIAVRAQIIEQDNCPHPDQSLKFDNGQEISSETLMPLFEIFISVSDKLDPPSKGDKIFVDYENRLFRTRPTYYGISRKGSETAGKKKDKKASQATPQQNSLTDSTKPPSGLNPIPSIQQQSFPTSGQNPCIDLKKANRQPGIWPITTGGSPPPNGYETAEMVIIPGSAFILFPKKYIKAVEAMIDAYKKETGQTLGFTSGYRNIDLQRCMYQDWLRKGKPFPQVGNPDKGSPKHTAGKALDFSTGKEGNLLFKQFAESSDFGSLKRVDKNAQSFEKTKNGDFGLVAKWLANNSQRFGFTWTGWSFKELWHYEFDENTARSLGLIE
jgi:LAS superfamily LD-carboxypeptidase LdcB